MKETRITQIRMTLSFWHTSHPIISDEFLVLMTHFGGCAPFPQPLEYVDPVLVIAQGDLCKLLQEEDTPYFLLVPPPDAFSTEDYTAWMGMVDHLGFTFEQLGHTIDYFSSQADFGPATGNIVALPGFRNVRYRISTAPYGRRHPCLKYVETLRAFYALPTSQHIIEFYDPPLPVVEYAWMTRLLTATVQALSALERKEFQRQQEIDRRAFQEGGHWLNHVSARYSSVDSDDSLPEHPTAPMGKRARMQYGPSETDEDIQMDLHDRDKTHPRNKALTKSTSLPKSPLKLVSKASGAAKKTGSPTAQGRPNFTQDGHFPRGFSAAIPGLLQTKASHTTTFPTSAAVQELETEQVSTTTADPEYAAPSAHSRTHSTANATTGTADQRAPPEEQENRTPPRGGAPPGTQTEGLSSHQQPLHTRQYLLSISAPNLLHTAAPETTVAQCATLNLRVWQWGTSEVSAGDHVIIAVARPHFSAMVETTTISWPTLLSGAIATYTVLYALTGGQVVLHQPQPFQEYPGMMWSDHFVIDNTSAAAPYLAGYSASTASTAALPPPPLPKARRRERSPSPSSSSSDSSSSSESSRRKRKRKHHAKHSKHGGKRSSKKHKHSKHSSRKPRGQHNSSSSESGTESDRQGTTTFKDAADRQVVRVKGTAVQTIRVSEPLRAFSPPAHVDAVLADVTSGRTDRDPSWYTLPAFHDLVWFNQRETNSGIVLKVFFFAFDLARCFTPDSLRLFHFLPTSRASQVANAHYKCTREDWVLILRGMAVTYGPAYDPVWQTAFQSMHSTACNEQVGHSFSFEYLEAYLNDMFFRFTQAARNPRLVVTLPGGDGPVLPLDLSPAQWASAVTTGFNSLVSLFDSPLTYQTYCLRKAGQQATPNPSYRPTRGTVAPTQQKAKSKPRADPTTPQTSRPPKPTTPGTARPSPSAPKICFMSFLREYKINLKTLNTLPKPCEAACKRTHYSALPKDFGKASALEIAKITTLVSEENRIVLIAAINSDNKLK
ncbi:hypothetical protein B484DRAFT_402290 [Ochromonadaceae sp. CCMP2298]|nr:hypothetical protein B484DRAFT_402290 [Ochromonadaceae sp. CCMP2298]